MKTPKWLEEGLKSIAVGSATGLAMTIFANTVSFLGDLNVWCPYLVLLLPLGGYLTMRIYAAFGQSYRAITAVAIDFIHDGEAMEAGQARHKPKLRITPMMGVVAYITAAIAHFTGASVGKEGAGVQIGLSIGELGYRLDKRLSWEGHRGRGDYYLMVGAGSAFGALFSAPVAGTLFGMTFASPDIIRLSALFPSLVASLTSVMVSTALGIHVMQIPSFTPLPLTGEYILYAIIAAFAIGLLARLFVFLLEAFKKKLKTAFSRPALRTIIPSIIAAAIFLATYAITGRDDYNGLSVTLLYDAMDGDGIPYLSFLLKAILVFLSIAAGFVGGEVVPLLVTGGTFGYVLASVLSLPTPAFTALGAIGMLSGGTNLPLVCFALGLELFGYTEPVLLFVTVAVAFMASGTKSIYQHQRKALRDRILTENK